MSLHLSSVSQHSHLDQPLLHPTRNEIMSMIGDAESTGYNRGRITVGLPTEGSECIQAIDATITYYARLHVHVYIGTHAPQAPFTQSVRKSLISANRLPPFSDFRCSPCPSFFVAVPVSRRWRRRPSDHPLPRRNRYLYRFQVRRRHPGEQVNLRRAGVYAPWEGASHDVLSSTHPARLGRDATGSCSRSGDGTA